jgi:hypothetical protein
VSLSKIIAAIGVNLVIPLLGVIAYGLLCRRMWRMQIASPPFLSYFILFATFGGWLMVLLTALFWEWSGMASLGVFYLVLIAPFLTAFLAWKLNGRRALSGFHQSAFVASISYSCLIVVAIFLLWLAYVTGLTGSFVSE